MTRMDRRALFATGSAAALLAAVGVSAEARPVRGGHLRAALSGGNRAETWLDVPGGRFLQATRNAVFETLTELAPDGTLQPGLATGWRPAEGGQVWELILRPDVLFHDGSPMEPADVVASLRAHGLKASGDTEVTVHLDRPDASFPLRLAKGGLAMFRAAELASGSVRHGTGLYRIRRFDAGAGFLGERVEKHRKDGQAGWFDSVEFVSVSDPAVRLSALQDGIVDLVDLEEGTEFSARPGLRPITHRGAMVGAAAETLASHLKTGPGALDDARFTERWWMTC